MIQILELFGGIGAPRCALRNLGVPVKAIDYVEIDEKAVRSYNAMFEKELKHKTQSVVGYNLKPDFLIHGSPCQDFSIAGKQRGADENSETRSSLMWETVHIIEQMGAWKPRVVIWENVKNVLSKHMKRNFDNYIAYMEKLGYTNSYKVLKATDYGLPQKRERVFVVSVLGNERFEFEKMRKRKPIDVQELLEESNSIDNKYLVTQQSVYNCIGKNGIRRATIIKNLACTITTRQDRTPAQVIDLKDGRYRYLTELECWRLQGFSDDDFYNAATVQEMKPSSMNRALYKQAGNSMPVTVLEEIFRVLLNTLFNFNIECENEMDLGQISVFDL